TALPIDVRRRHEQDLLRHYLGRLAAQGVAAPPGFDEAFTEYRRTLIWGVYIGWLTTSVVNYGWEINTVNLLRLTTAYDDHDTAALVAELMSPLIHGVCRDLGIAGDAAFVSGGTRGIGRAAADIFAREGCKVIVVGRRQHSVDEAVAAMRATGATVAGVAADLTDRADVERAVAFARDTFGSPDIVVTNVHLGDGGADGEGTFDTLTDEDYMQAFQHLTMSVVYLTRAVIPHMKAQGWGRLINVGSGAAKEPPAEIEH